MSRVRSSASRSRPPAIRRRRRSRASSSTGQTRSCGPGIRPCSRRVPGSRIRCSTSSRSRRPSTTRTCGYAEPSDAGAPPRTGYVSPWPPARRCAGAGRSRSRSDDAGDGACPCWSTATSTGWNARTGCPSLAARRGSGTSTGNRYLDNLYKEYAVCVETRRDRSAPSRRAVARQAARQRQHSRRHRHAQVRAARPGRSPMRDRESRGQRCCAGAAGQGSPRACAGPRCAQRPIS